MSHATKMIVRRYFPTYCDYGDEPLQKWTAGSVDDLTELRGLTGGVKLVRRSDHIMSGKYVVGIVVGEELS